MLNLDSERAVYRIRAGTHTAILRISTDDLKEFIGATAAEANHEADRRPERSLDDALDILNTAAQDL